MRSVLAVLGVLLFTGAAGGQSVIPPVGETIDVSIVNLDVVVTDTKGKRVRGLTRDDFIVLEDGRPQTITNFAEYAGDGPAASSLTVETAAPREVQPPPARARTIVLFMDQLPLPPYHAKTFFEGLKSLLHRVVRPGDSLMIVSWMHAQPVHRLSMTDDLEAIDATIDTIAVESGLLSSGVEGQIQMEKEFRRMAAELAATRGFVLDFTREDPTLSELAAGEEARGDLRRKMKAMGVLMRAIAADPGKKIMIFAAHRLSRYAGRDVRLPRNAQAGPPTRADLMTDMQNEIAGLIRTANANDITMYTLFPEGIVSDVGVPADVAESPGPNSRDALVLHNEIEPLGLVADRTGGMMEWAAPKIVEMLPAIEEDLSAYYSLAYRVRASGSDRRRSVVVQTKDPALRVRSRREFVEKSDDTRMRDLVMSNLLREVPAGSLPLQIAHGAIVKQGKKYRAPVRVRIPGASIMSPGKLSVYVGWSGVLGEIGDVTKATFQTKEKGMFTYDFDLMLDQKTQNIAVAVFDETSREFGVARLELPPRGEE